MGMGSDRVIEFKIVTPDGQLRVANAYQNTDLFFAVRGGGPGTPSTYLWGRLLTGISHKLLTEL